MSYPISAKRVRRQRGTWLLEFALCSVFIIPLFLATVGTGLSMSRAIQTTQLCRDAGHMYMDQIDFSNVSNQKLIGRLAFGLGMTSDSSGTINTSGNGVVIFTTIMMIGSVECAAAGYATTGACPNYNKKVITDRTVVGNSNLRTSTYGTPATNIVAGDGSITIYNYCTNATVVVPASTYADKLNLQAGQFTYASEAFITTPELAGFNWTGSTGVNSTYAYNFF
jgi:hypothetical protein